MAYTYLIGWKNCNKYYYGVRFSKKSDPKELWVSYFTSSKYVKEFAKLHGNPDIVEVRKIFNTVEKAIKWETRVLTRMKVLTDEKWINKTNNRAIDPTYALHGWKDSSRKKASDSHKGKIRSESHKLNLSLSLTNRKCDWLLGKERPDHSQKMKGVNNPRALTVLYKNKVYETLKDLSESENISYYLIKRMINNQEIYQIQKEIETWPSA